MYVHIYSRGKIKNDTMSKTIHQYHKVPSNSFSIIQKRKTKLISHNKRDNSWKLTSTLTYRPHLHIEPEEVLIKIVIVLVTLQTYTNHHELHTIDLTVVSIV